MTRWLSLDECLDPSEDYKTELQALQEIRQRSFELGWGAHVTLEYALDVCDLVRRLADHPGPVIELGTYFGGMSVQLAFLCEMIGKTLYCIDIDPHCIAITQEHMRKLNLYKENIQFYTGTIDDFFAEHALTMPPSLVIIDAMHTYDCSRHDLSAILRYQSCTEVIVMHDYGLVPNPIAIKEKRYPSHYVDVKRAVHHVCGHKSPLVKFGKTEFDRVCPDKSILNYFRGEGDPEAVAIFPGLLPAEAIHRACTFWSIDSINLICGDQKSKEVTENHIFLSANNEWRDAIIHISEENVLHGCTLRLECINLGKPMNFRFSVLAPDEDNVFEQMFQVKTGTTRCAYVLTNLGVLRGEPDISKATSVHIGGLLHKDGVYVSAELHSRSELIARATCF